MFYTAVSGVLSRVNNNIAQRCRNLRSWIEGGSVSLPKKIELSYEDITRPKKWTFDKFEYEPRSNRKKDMMYHRSYTEIDVKHVYRNRKLRKNDNNLKYWERDRERSSNEMNKVIIPSGTSRYMQSTHTSSQASKVIISNRSLENNNTELKRSQSVPTKLNSGNVSLPNSNTRRPLTLSSSLLPSSSTSSSTNLNHSNNRLQPIENTKYESDTSNTSKLSLVRRRSSKSRRPSDLEILESFPTLRLVTLP